MSTAAIIVAGGRARRLGGIAKPWLEVCGRPMIEHVIDAARQHASLILVVAQAPREWTPPTGVRMTIETERGAGPAAAIRAGMTLLDPDVTEVLLLAGDAPFVSTTLAELMHAAMLLDGVAARDHGGVQFLCARIARPALATALDRAGASMGSVFDHLQIETIASEVRDADTWEDVAELREQGGATVNAWLHEVSELVGTEVTIDIDAVLELARDVAHNVERKNAPLSSYYLGYAAASRGLTPAQIAELAATIGARAKEFGDGV